MVISTEFNQDESILVISYYDKDGNTAFIKKPILQHDLFNWAVTPLPTEYRNWDEKFLKKVQGKWLSRFRLEELTQSRLDQDELAAIYADFNPKKYYFDIEIKLDSTEFPEPEKAEKPVNLISLVNSNNDVFVLSTMKALNTGAINQLQDEVNEYFVKHNQTFKIKYLYFEHEEDLLKTFFHKMLPKIPFLTGWNITSFDWLYLVNRCKNIKIDAMQFMPTNVLIGKSRMPVHLGLLDYMEVFMNTKPYKVVENYKLDYVSNLVLGTTKLHGNYKSMLEAQQDCENFIKYNIIDTILVKLIEDKLGLLDVAFAIAKFAKVDVSKVFSAVFITETLMCREFLERGRFMSNDRRGIEEDATYAGAYVSTPVPGYYQNIMLDDFASMYPNIQIQFNVSPDSFRGKVEPGYRPDPSEILTKNETVFASTFDSAARTILKRMYNGRVSTKGEMKKLETILSEL